MSATVVETSPAWIFKLLSEDKKREYFRQAKNSNKGSTDMAHKCAALRAFESSIPPPSSPPPAPPITTAPSLFSSPPPAVELPTQSYSLNKVLPTSAGIVNAATAMFASQPSTATPKNDSPYMTDAHADYICEFLRKVKEPIVIYEEQKGIPRDMQYSFIGLMTTLAQQTYNAVFIIFTMLINLIPLAEGFLQMLRFIIDKSIDICVTPHKKDKAFKLVVFAGELVIMFFAAVIITGIVFVPVLNLLCYAFFKLWSIVLPH